MVVTSFSFCSSVWDTQYFHTSGLTCLCATLDGLRQLKINQETNIGLHVSDLDSFFK